MHLRPHTRQAFSLLFFCLFIILFTAPTHAGTVPVPLTFQKPDQFSITSLGSFIGAVASLMFIISGILVFVYIVWGGLQWLTSGGDTAGIQAGRDKITAALIGLSIVCLALAISIIIEYFYGVHLFDYAGSVVPVGY